MLQNGGILTDEFSTYNSGCLLIMIQMTEVFVLAVFVIGLPLSWGMLRRSAIRGGGCFIAGYCALLLSNIFTIIEECWYHDLFNLCEHLSIAAGAAMFLAAIIQFTGHSESGLQRGNSQTREK